MAPEVGSRIEIHHLCVWNCQRTDKGYSVKKIRFMVPEEQRVELWPPHTQVYPNKHEDSLLYTP